MTDREILKKIIEMASNTPDKIYDSADSISTIQTFKEIVDMVKNHLEKEKT